MIGLLRLPFYKPRNSMHTSVKAGRARLAIGVEVHNKYCPVECLLNEMSL